jgi:hypothetical protein
MLKVIDNGISISNNFKINFYQQKSQKVVEISKNCIESHYAYNILSVNIANIPVPKQNCLSEIIAILNKLIISFILNIYDSF